MAGGLGRKIPQLSAASYGLFLVRPMTRVVSFAFAVVDIVLAAFATLYGALVAFIILRPWGGSLRALFFAGHPEALLAFFAGVACVVAVPLAFVSRRISGIIWCCAFIAFQIWLAA